MLIFSKQKLAFLAVPKTGTTAFEMALKSRADIIFTKRRKHLNAIKFQNRIAPFLRDALATEVETMAVMRDPVDQIRSWYRYRSRPDAAEGPMSTKGCSFDDFVTEVIADKPRPFAEIGSQYQFLTDSKGTLLVDHLFAWERAGLFQDFVENHFGEKVQFKRKNVSPEAPAWISPDVEAALRAARTEEFALYASLMAAEGHLHTPQAASRDAGSAWAQ